MSEIIPGIDESHLQFDYIRASGPGGQNVNKVSSAVQLRFAVLNASLPEDVQQRLIKLAGSKIIQGGVLLIEAKRYRTQEQNKLDAIRRLADLLAKACKKEKARLATKPGVTAKARRVNAKKRRGDVKRTRRYNPEIWE